MTQKGFAPIILVLLLLGAIVAIGTFYYFGWNKKQEAPPPSEEKQISAKEESYYYQKTYQSNKFNFRFNYFSDSKIYYDSTQYDTIGQPYVFLLRLANDKFKGGASNYFTLQITKGDKCPVNEKIRTTKITVYGLDADYFEHSGAYDMYYRNICLAKDGLLFNFDNNFQNALPEDKKTESLELFDDIIKSFVFSDSGVGEVNITKEAKEISLDWLRYTDQAIGFSIDFPEGWVLRRSEYVVDKKSLMELGFSGATGSFGLVGPEGSIGLTIRPGGLGDVCVTDENGRLTPGTDSGSEFSKIYGTAIYRGLSLGDKKIDICLKIDREKKEWYMTYFEDPAFDNKLLVSFRVKLPYDKNRPVLFKILESFKRLPPKL